MENAFLGMDFSHRKSISGNGLFPLEIHFWKWTFPVENPFLGMDFFRGNPFLGMDFFLENPFLGMDFFRKFHFGNVNSELVNPVNP